MLVRVWLTVNIVWAFVDLRLDVFGFLVDAVVFIVSNVVTGGVDGVVVIDAEALDCVDDAVAVTVD